MDKVSGGKRTFINFTQDLLIRRLPMMFPRQKVVVEVLEDVLPSPEVIAACQDISNHGYSIALDDFFYRSELDPLISLADIIKFDFRLSPLDDIRDCLKVLSHHDLSFLAEKVETHEEFDHALEMGFDYFQGFFFSKPEVMKQREISTPQMHMLQIMAEANKEEVDFGHLEELITRDVAIPYKLLRYINSAYFRRIDEVSSIRQAISLLGVNGTKQFLSLMVLARLADTKPDELIRMSIARAKFCELVGKHQNNGKDPSMLFLLGLFSLIDAILDNSMEHLVEQLPLCNEVRHALTTGDGILGGYLNLVTSYERGNWDNVSGTTTALGVEESDMAHCYEEAVAWADTICDT
jgi:EAL and modified HD-GYP domain-containing signal transduction protein